jgi:hypothetical protein
MYPLRERQKRKVANLIARLSINYIIMLVAFPVGFAFPSSIFFITGEV